MFSTKVAFTIVASIALASAAPGLLGGLGLGGGSDGGVGGIIGGGQGGVGGLLGSGGILGGLLGDNGLVGGLLGNLLGGDGIESLLEGVLNNGPLSNLLQPLLGQVLKLVETLLQDIQNILSNLSAVLDGLTGILGQDLPLPEQAKAIEELRNKNPVEFDTIMFIASQLAQQQGGNGGVVPKTSGQTSEQSQSRIRIRP